MKEWQWNAKQESQQQKRPFPVKYTKINQKKTKHGLNIMINTHCLSYSMTKRHLLVAVLHTSPAVARREIAQHSRISLMFSPCRSEQDKPAHEPCR